MLFKQVGQGGLINPAKPGCRRVIPVQDLAMGIGDETGRHIARHDVHDHCILASLGAGKDRRVQPQKHRQKRQGRGDKCRHQTVSGTIDHDRHGTKGHCNAQ